MKYKTKEAATAALAKLGGRELADFPGQTVWSPLPGSPGSALHCQLTHCSASVSRSPRATSSSCGTQPAAQPAAPGNWGLAQARPLGG